MRYNRRMDYSHFDYDPDTGDIKLKTTGESVVRVGKSGIPYVSSAGVRRSAARVAYRMAFGKEPPVRVQVVDGNPLNLRKRNLKELSFSSELTLEIASQYVRYDAETGFLYRCQPANRTGPRVDTSKPVSTRCAKGYVVTEIQGKQYKGHRLAWLFSTGKMPELPLDHINGKRYDNRFSNLREVTDSQNTRNQKRVKKAKLITLKETPHGLRIEARCVINGKQRKIGYFNDLAEAERAVEKFRKEHEIE